MKILAGLGLLGTLSGIVIVMLLQTQETQTLLAPQAPAKSGSAPASIPQTARTSDARVSFQPLLLDAKVELELEGGTLDQAALVASLAASEPQAKIGRPGGTLVTVLPGGHSILLCSAAGMHAVACEADDLILSRSGQATATSLRSARAQATAALAASK
jgi:hypothetical protein